MRSRSRKSTGRRTRGSSVSRRAGRTAPRRQPTAREPLRPRRSNRYVFDTAERRRPAQRSRPSRDTVPVRKRDRRNRLRSSERTRRRLSPLAVSARRTNENASDSQTTRSVCTRKKATRRAVIIATGYGGRNGARNYSRRKSCGTN